MDRDILQKTNLGQLLLEKTEWFENQLSFQGDSSTNDFRLKPTQRSVLSMLQEKPLRNSDLARKIGISQPAVHKTVSSLAKSGILELFPDPTSKSAKLVQMTKEGERMFEGTIKKISSIEEELAQIIGYEKMQLLFEVLGCQWDRKLSTKYDKEKDLVHVLLPRPVYKILGNLSADMVKSIPEILENIILHFSSQLGGINVDRGKIEKDWDRILTQIKNVKKKQIDESVRFNQRALQGIEKRPKTEEALQDDKRKYLEILEHSYDVIYRFNVKTRKYEYINPSTLRNWKITSEEVFSMDVEDLFFLVHPDDRKIVVNHHKNTLLNRPEEKGRSIEFRAKRKDGEYRWFSQTNAIVLDDNSEPISMVCSLRDITERKKEEEKLLELVNQFERKVKDYSANMEESNSALRVLLKQYQKEKEEMEDKILFNLKELVSPVIEKMKHHKSKDLQTQINTLEANLNQITSSFSRKMTKKHLKLTHQEIQVSNHIMHGKTTKEIADLMGLAERTVDFHRAKIRKKMGLVNKKENLRTYLLSLQ